MARKDGVRYEYHQAEEEAVDAWSGMSLCDEAVAECARCGACNERCSVTFALPRCLRFEADLYCAFVSRGQICNQ